MRARRNRRSSRIAGPITADKAKQLNEESNVRRAYLCGSEPKDDEVKQDVEPNNEEVITEDKDTIVMDMKDILEKEEDKTPSVEELAAKNPNFVDGFKEPEQAMGQQYGLPGARAELPAKKLGDRVALPDIDNLPKPLASSIRGVHSLLDHYDKMQVAQMKAGAERDKYFDAANKMRQKMMDAIDMHGEHIDQKAKAFIQKTLTRWSRVLQDREVMNEAIMQETALGSDTVNSGHANNPGTPFEAEMGKEEDEDSMVDDAKKLMVADEVLDMLGTGDELAMEDLEKIIGS
jgi:hypothetical protein